MWETAVDAANNSQEVGERGIDAVLKGGDFGADEENALLQGRSLFMGEG